MYNYNNNFKTYKLAILKIQKRPVDRQIVPRHPWVRAPSCTWDAVYIKTSLRQAKVKASIKENN